MSLQDLPHRGPACGMRNKALEGGCAHACKEYAAEQRGGGVGPKVKSFALVYRPPRTRPNDAATQLCSVTTRLRGDIHGMEMQ